MLREFALAFKTKTFEFFAEEEEEYDDDIAGDVTISAVDLESAPEELITDQRVVVDEPEPQFPVADPQFLLAIVSSFRAAYLHLQTAHSPFDADAVCSADRSAVSLLRRLSHLKLNFFPNPDSNPNPNPKFDFSSLLEAQVQDNQSLLRAFGAIINRLGSDIDRRDTEAAALRNSLRDLEDANSKLERRLESACSPPDEKVEALLSVSVFDSVLKDSFRATHRFTRVLIDLMQSSGWELESAAGSIYPGVVYAKPGHCRYAVLSYVCLGMFGGFGSDEFSSEDGRFLPDSVGNKLSRTNSLTQFIEHSALDPLDLMEASPSCEFATFCTRKYQKLINSGFESLLFGNSDHRGSMLSSLQTSSPLYEPFVNMASSVWMLHKLASVYDPTVEIFQVGRGTEFSMVYMESVVRGGAPTTLECGKALRPKVGFTVVPGFRVGKTVIQCRVYVDGL